MSKKKSRSKHTQKKEEMAVVAEAISKSEEFLNKYKNHILYTVLGVVILLGLVFAYMEAHSRPQTGRSLGATVSAEQYFRIDSFDLALNGDGNILGFKDIIKDYKKKAGPLVYFYAGVCELQLENYTEAIDFLRKYKTGDEIIQARAYANIADAYVGLINWTKGCPGI